MQQGSYFLTLILIQLSQNKAGRSHVKACLVTFNWRTNACRGNGNVPLVHWNCLALTVQTCFQQLWFPLAWIILLPPSLFSAMSSPPLLPSLSQCHLHSSIPPALCLSPPALWALQAFLVFKDASQQYEMHFSLYCMACFCGSQGMQTAECANVDVVLLITLNNELQTSSFFTCDQIS